jgi:3'(2'), 5'-bisphosphate nucleotidase
MPSFSAAQIQAICQLIQTCGQTAQHMAAQDFQVYEKGKHDYVTDVDQALDQQLTAGLASLFPADPIISEENPNSWSAFASSLARQWFVDPLDGTDDFIHGRPNYAVMAGLLTAHQPIAGWIYAPVSAQLYYGGSEIGLFQATGTAPVKPLQPVEPAHPSASFCPILLGYKDQQRFGQAIAHLIPAAQFASIGSFGLKVIQVICGQAGLYIYLNGRVKLWDTTAPLALATAAGLVCCDLNGEPLRFTSDVVDPYTLVHRQPIIVGWRSYVNALLPCLQQAVLECCPLSERRF